MGARGFTVGGAIVGRSSQFLVGDEGNQNRPVRGYVLVNLHGSVELFEGVSLFG